MYTKCIQNSSTCGPATALESSIDGGLKGTLMQISKSVPVFVFMWK